MNDLKEVYNVLDAMKSFSALNIEIKQHLQKMINETTTAESICNAAKIELAVLSIQPDIDNYINMEVSPNIDNIYIENRTKETKNAFLLARYYHLLWISKKHHDYAIEAIRNYIIAKDYSIKTKSTNNDWAMDVLESITRA